MCCCHSPIHSWLFSKYYTPSTPNPYTLSFLPYPAPCMERQHYSSQIIRKEKKTSFFKLGNFFQVLSCEIWNPCMDSFFFFKIFFFFMRPLLNLFSLLAPPPSPTLEFSGSPPSFSLSPRTFIWLVWLDWEEMGSVVIKTGGNRIHSHLVQA